MKSHNSKAAFAFHKTPAVSRAGKEEAKIISATLNAADLALADDADDFCDPYNSTGKHVILKAKLMKRDRD